MDVGVEEHETISKNDPTHYKPFVKVYKNKVDFEKELISLGDTEAQIKSFATEGAHDDDDAILAAHIKVAIQSGVGETYNNIMRRQPLKDEIPFNLKDIYRKCIIEVFEDVTERDLPKKGKVTPGIRFPLP